MITIYFNIVGGYLDGWSSTPSNAENEHNVDVEKDHEVLRNPEIFKYVDGELIKDEERQNELIAEAEEEKNKLSKEDMQALATMELAEIILNGGI